MSRNYQDPLYKQWRQKIYARDKFTCQWPNCKSKTKLNAHHIQRWADFPGLRYHINNGITLCKHHHQFIKDNEENYCAFFNSLILKKLKE
jgi:hypothetical protein